MSSFWHQGLSRRLASLAAAKHLLICSDYDGTLSPLAERPEQAKLLPGASNLLHDLARLPHTRVAIISGRSRNDLSVHSGLAQPVMLVGSHGGELPGRTLDAQGPGALAKLDALESALARICASAPGAWVERKPLGLAVHVRQASRKDADRVLHEARSQVAAWPAEAVMEGKAILEASLSRSNKGDAVAWLRQEWDTDPQILYLGDDTTDESAFRVLSHGDVGVKVGPGASEAGYRVASELAALSVLAFVWQRRSSFPVGRPQRRPRGIAA